MPGPKFDTHVLFNNTAQAIRQSSEEQVKIERAVGRALLGRLGGDNTNLLAAYHAIGGSDPAVVDVFTDLNSEIAKINFANVRTVASMAANKASVAAKKSTSIKADNPVFSVEHTALNTLASLGGAAFAQKFNIPK